MSNREVFYEFPQSKLSNIENLLDSYWGLDVWNIMDKHFDKYRPVKWHKYSKKIDFSHIDKILIKKEIKFFCAKQIVDKKKSLTTIINYGPYIKKFIKFINYYYPYILSISQIPYEEGYKYWGIYLRNIENIDFNYSRYNVDSNYKAVFTNLTKYFNTYYDIKPEIEKDIWELANIPGTQYNIANSPVILKFLHIPNIHRPLVKRYFRSIIYKFKGNTCKLMLSNITHFLTFIYNRYPKWTNLNELTRKDFIDYSYEIKKNNKHLTYNYISSKFSHIRSFIDYIQRAYYPEAPKISCNILIHKEDITFKRWSISLKEKEVKDKYIPESVLRQLDENLDSLKPTKYIPIIILLRISGWRISDILNLKYDSCLEKTENGWYLKGDIQKTYLLEHRIPITKEVATMIKVICRKVENNSNNNPKKYLFANLTGPRKGLPPLSKSVSSALNRLAKNNYILDNNGKIFKFKNHAFRHTKAIELINNGMSLFFVQNWLAHTSPEMTLNYAKILDSTLRNSWIKTVKDGFFRINSEGKVDKVNLKNLDGQDLVEWEYIRHNLDAVRIPMGYCMKPTKLVCHAQLNPCLLCNNFCTTPEFLSEFELETTKIQKMIDLGKSQGRTLWVEKNLALMKKYNYIIEVLKENDIFNKSLIR